MYSIFKPTQLTTATFALLISSLLIGCQTTPKPQKPVVSTPVIVTNTPAVPTSTVNTPTTTTSVPSASVPLRFDINGKIGIITPKEASSAFYTWSQVGNSFIIDLEGAFGMGHMNVENNGVSTTITNDKRQTMTASTPEALLKKATGWQTPISQLPYWLMGQNAPSDTASSRDSQQRLISASNSGWTANFNYNGNVPRPSKLVMLHQNGTKVTMTINPL